MRIQFLYIVGLLVCIGCANNSSKEAESDTEVLKTEEETSLVSEEEAYSILILQKLKEIVDKKVLADTHPDFDIDPSIQSLYPAITDTKVKEVHLISPFEIVSDSVKSVKTKVVYETKTDTIITYIKTSEMMVDGEQLKTTKMSFTPQLPKITSKKPKDDSKPLHVERFSIRDLSFTWEEVNACDCLFMIPAKNSSFKKLYFGRFKDNTTAIIQLGKNTEKYLIPISKSRSPNRKNGASWSETYQSDTYKLSLTAKPTTNKVKGKHTYLINFTFTDVSSKKVIQKEILANCKS